MIVNQGNLGNLFTGFKTAFNNGFRGVMPDWDKVATLVQSGTRTENYSWLGQFPQLREWLGDRQVKSMSQYNYSITNKTYEGTVSVAREDIEDDQFGVYSPMFQEMGHAAATHPDSLVFALMAAGFATLCYDGQYFFDTDHPVGTGTSSNSGGGSGAPWVLMDASRPLKPFIFQRRRDYQLIAMTDPNDEGVFTRKEFRYGVDGRCNVGYGFWQMAYGSKQTLDAGNFNAARAALEGYRSDEGRPLGIKPNLLVVGPSNRAAAEALLLAQMNAAGASNTLYKAVGLVVTPWLT